LELWLPFAAYRPWSDPKRVQDALVEWLCSVNPGLAQYHNVVGHQMIRVCCWNDPPLPKLTPLRPAPEEEEEPPIVDPIPAQPTVSRARVIARDLLPPVVTRALRRAGRRLRSS
jgi:hypothetical protein